MHQQQTAFQNIVGKEEIDRNKLFLLFPQCFLINQKIVSPFVNVFDILSLFATDLEEPKIGISGKGIKGLKTPCKQSRTDHYGFISGISKYGSIDGLFLVRESSFSSSSFVLSLVSRGNFFHFQINEVKKTHFSIDDGPVIQGKHLLY